MSKPLNEYWIKDRFEAPEGLYLKNLGRIHPEIFGPLDVAFPHMFLFSLESLDLLLTQKFWVARDGYALLRFFFQRFPKAPEGFNSKIYIHDRLKKLVPKEWEGHFYSFTVHSEPLAPGKELHLLFHPHLPSLKIFDIPRVDTVALTFYNKGLGFAFHESEKSLMQLFSALHKTAKNWKLFKLDHYAQYPNDSETSFINVNDEFFCSLSQSLMLYLNFNYRLVDDQKLNGAEELRLNLFSSLLLGTKPIISIPAEPTYGLIKEFVEKTYTDQLLPHFPFTQNFIRTSFEMWKVK